MCLLLYLLPPSVPRQEGVREIARYSKFPAEAEALLMPNSEFIVKTGALQEDWTAKTVGQRADIFEMQQQPPHEYTKPSVGQYPNLPGLNAEPRQPVPMQDVDGEAQEVTCKCKYCQKVIWLNAEGWEFHLHCLDQHCQTLLQKGREAECHEWCGRPDVKEAEAARLLMAAIEEGGDEGHRAMLSVLSHAPFQGLPSRPLWDYPSARYCAARTGNLRALRLLVEWYGSRECLDVGRLRALDGAGPGPGRRAGARGRPRGPGGAALSLHVTDMPDHADDDLYVREAVLACHGRPVWVGLRGAKYLYYCEGAPGEAGARRGEGPAPDRQPGWRISDHLGHAAGVQLYTPDDPRMPPAFRDVLAPFGAAAGAGETDAAGRPPGDGAEARARPLLELLEVEAPPEEARRRDVPQPPPKIRLEAEGADGGAAPSFADEGRVARPSEHLVDLAAAADDVSSVVSSVSGASAASSRGDAGHWLCPTEKPPPPPPAVALLHAGSPRWPAAPPMREAQVQAIPHGPSLLEAAVLSRCPAVVDYVIAAYKTWCPAAVVWQYEIADGLWQTYPEPYQRQIRAHVRRAREARPESPGDWEPLQLRHGAVKGGCTFHAELDFHRLTHRAGARRWPLRGVLRPLVQYRSGGDEEWNVIDDPSGRVFGSPSLVLVLAPGAAALAAADSAALKQLTDGGAHDPFLWDPPCAKGTVRRVVWGPVADGHRKAVEGKKRRRVTAGAGAAEKKESGTMKEGAVQTDKAKAQHKGDDREQQVLGQQRLLLRCPFGTSPCPRSNGMGPISQIEPYTTVKTPNCLMAHNLND